MVKHSTPAANISYQISTHSWNNTSPKLLTELEQRLFFWLMLITINCILSGNLSYVTHTENSHRF